MYQIKRREIIVDLLKNHDERSLGMILQHSALSPAIKDEGGMTQKIMGELYNVPDLPVAAKGILDSTSGTTGNVLIRQDLEPVLYALFVKRFPMWDRMLKVPSNGLVHAATQITTPSSGSDGSSFIAELGSVPFETGTNVRATYPIAVMANGRGVSLKEIAAVAQGGAAYNPQEIESQNAMTKLARDAQWALFQGNATNTPSADATTEKGIYNALAFDGFRGVIGSTGAFSANNAIQLDIANLNMLESIQTVAATSANNGGDPTLVAMSITAKQYLDIEQQDNVRYTTMLADLVPGVKCNTVTYAQGELAITAVPGNSIGTYLRTSDSVSVEDIYVIDESGVKVRWLYSPDWTVLQFPTGIGAGNFELSDRIAIFGLYGLEIANPVFQGKARRTV